MNNSSFLNLIVMKKIKTITLSISRLTDLSIMGESGWYEAEEKAAKFLNINLNDYEILEEIPGMSVRGGSNSTTCLMAADGYALILILKTIKMKKLLKLGFKKLFIRKVPYGAVLNAETANSFPIIDSGSYIREDRTIISRYYGDKYFILPPEPVDDCLKKGIYRGEHTLEKIILEFEKLSKWKTPK